MHRPVQLFRFVIALGALHAGVARSQPTTAGAAQAPRDDRRAIGVVATLDGTFGRVASTAASFSGFDIAMLIDHRLSIGVSGYVLATRNVRVGPTPGATIDTLRFGYGGIRVGYAVHQTPRVHWTGELLLGAGRAWTVANARESDDDDGEGLLVIEPSLGAEFSVTPHVRLGAGVTYRYVGNVDVAGITAADLRSPTLRLAVRVGRF